MHKALFQRSRARSPAKTRLGRLQRHWLALSLLVMASACSTSEPASGPESGLVEDTETTASPIKPVKEMSDEKHSSAPGAGQGKSSHLVPPDIMQRLTDAVATEAGVSPSEVKLERAEKATFSDSSLDCPQPNMAYAQVIVNGYWVVFHVGREEYDMRVTQKGSFSRCTGSTKRAPIRYDDT